MELMMEEEEGCWVGIFFIKASELTGLSEK